MILQNRSLQATAILFFAFFSSVAWAQDIKIIGVIKDASGAVLPGVLVTATNQINNTTQTATTDADGSYSISAQPGAYSLAATLQGFRKVMQTLEISSGENRQIDFVMEAALNEEMTVTAMKREASVQNVPFSVAAPSEQVLRERGVENVEGIAANVGGFTVQNLGPGQSQVSMRGISAGQIVRDQPGVKEQVGIYLDESLISLSLFTPDLDLLDISRVEVLRGPQGTLFGSGSLSGTVRYITNQPELDLRKGFAEIGLSAVQEGSIGGSAKVGLNVPLGEKAALRVASYYNQIPGYIDAIQPDLSVKENVNDGFRAGGRAALKFAPNESLTITPRLVYQKVDMDGWNRMDAFNILANPYTTTRPPVEIGEREQFTQLEEKFTDDFLLGDLNISYIFGDMSFTSITSYTYRDVLVVRDATALTASITGGSIGLPENVYTLDAALNDATTAKLWTQELRLAGGKDRFQWVAGAFYSHTDRDYGQDLPVIGFENLTGIPTQGLRAPKDSLYFSDLSYKLDQFALFGEATLSMPNGFSMTGGLRYYRFNEDKEQIFDGIFGNDNNGSALVSQPGKTDANGIVPRLIAAYKLSENINVNAQVSRGFRLGGINDPLNIPLCTAQDLETFGGRENWKDETVWNYELGVKSKMMDGNSSLNLSAFYMDIQDLQATVTAGSCSSRVIFNVPKARSQGFEAEFEAALNENFDFAVSGSFSDSELRSTLTSTDSNGNVSVVSGIEEGRRLPTVPKLQFSTAANYQWEIRPGSLAYITGSFQHIGSRFTQVGDEDLGTLNLSSFGSNTIGGPLTESVFTYDAELPAYNVANVRIGLRRVRWDFSVYVNNVTDELALLSFDQERGTRARIGYLTNQPRTFGLTARFDF